MATKGKAPRRRRARPRRNSPRQVQVRQFGGAKGHLVGTDVLAIEYRNIGSWRTKPYRHDFESTGVQLWALADGSILIKHPTYRLWDDFNVSDTE